MFCFWRNLGIHPTRQWGGLCPLLRSKSDEQVRSTSKEKLIITFKDFKGGGKMSLKKINESDYAEKGIRVKSNPLNVTASVAQRYFDELNLDVVIPAFNELSDELDIKMEEFNRDISTKVDKETGKGLSSNDYTDSEKAAVAEIGNKADLSQVLTKTNTEVFVPTGMYQPATKKYVDDTVVAVGAADMTKAVYDPNGKEQDIFAYTDEKVGGVTVSSIGAASASHTHSLSSLGAAASSHTHKVSDISDITVSTTDLTAGESTLATGSLYFVYE
jgi:hypothetical protein